MPTAQTRARSCSHPCTCCRCGTSAPPSRCAGRKCWRRRGTRRGLASQPPNLPTSSTLGTLYFNINGLFISLLVFKYNVPSVLVSEPSPIVTLPLLFTAKRLVAPTRKFINKLAAALAVAVTFRSKAVNVTPASFHVWVSVNGDETVSVPAARVAVARKAASTVPLIFRLFAPTLPMSRSDAANVVAAVRAVRFLSAIRPYPLQAAGNHWRRPPYRLRARENPRDRPPCPPPTTAPPWHQTVPRRHCWPEEAQGRGPAASARPVVNRKLLSRSHRPEILNIRDVSRMIGRRRRI